ncbi:MAG: hypothetical protein AAF823_04780 [Planctomycetota bacterium]
MPQTTDRGFGLIIAYLVPGFGAILALSTLSPTIRLWLNMASSYALEAPDFAGVVYVVFASLGMGLVFGAIRWAVIDQINAATGIGRPQLNDALMEERLNAYGLFISIHYQYHKFYAHSLIAGVVYAVVRRETYGLTGSYDLIDGTLAILLVIFWFAQRNALKMYYTRAERLLSHTEEGLSMTNGGHHETTPTRPQSKPAPKTGQGKGQTAKGGKATETKKN